MPSTHVKLSASRPRTSAQRTKREAAAGPDLPAVFLDAALSKKIDAAIVDVGRKKERQLKFTSEGGFRSPQGAPLQVAYLAAKASKSGLNIAYVDAKREVFWAQAPGVSGLARGPFQLPPGAARALERVTAKHLDAATPSHQRPAARRSDDFVFQPTAEDNAEVRRNLESAIARYSTPFDFTTPRLGWDT